MSCKIWKNPYRRSWDINWLNFRAKTAHLAQFFFFFFLNLIPMTFFLFICSITCKNLKIYLEQILRYKLAYFWATIRPKLSIRPKWFLYSYCHVSWSQKSLERILRQKLDKNCLHDPNEDFLENFTEIIFIYLLCPSCCKVQQLQLMCKKKLAEISMNLREWESNSKVLNTLFYKDLIKGVVTLILGLL